MLFVGIPWSIRMATVAGGPSEIRHAENGLLDEPDRSLVGPLLSAAGW